MANSETVERFQQQYAENKSRLPGDAQVRDQAIAQLVTDGLPTRKTERWRYTRLNKVLKQDFAPAQLVDPAVERAGNEQAKRLAEQVAEVDGAVLVFDQGYFRPEVSRLDGLGDIEFKPLSDALAAGDISLPTAKVGADRAFDQLNTALVADGAWLNLPAGRHRPVTLLVLAGDGADKSAYWRLVVSAQSQSEAEISIAYAGGGADTYHSNNYIDVDLAAGARLRLSQLQRQGDQAFHVAALRASLARDSSFTAHLLALGADISRDDVDITLADQGAHAEVNGLQLTNDRQHADLHLNLEHASPHCTSAVSHHGLFGGHGKGVFNGRVHVHPGADGTDSQMSSNNLLLSDQAEINTKPELEIYADDVKCSHGATVGDLNPDELFYLRSRGIGEAQARALLLNAFAAASFSSLTGQWGQFVATDVSKKMEQLSHE